MWAAALPLALRARAGVPSRVFRAAFSSTAASDVSADVPVPAAPSPSSPAEPRASVNLYSSDTSLLARLAGSLLSFKAAVAATGGAYLGTREFSKLQTLLQAANEAAQEAPLEWSAFVASTTLPSPDFRVPVVLLGLAAFSQWFGHRLLHRIAVAVDVQPQDHGDTGNDIITVTHMALLGTAKKQFLRKDCKSASSSTLTTHFIACTPKGWQTSYYLLPKDGWTSQDKAYLRHLVYEQYFRPEEVAPPDETQLLGQIEGFGSFRPAQFADPSHPASRALPSAEQLAHTPFRVVNGEVYADFVLPAPLTLEQRRAVATEQALAAAEAAVRAGTAALPQPRGRADPPLRVQLPALPVLPTLPADAAADAAVSTSLESALAGGGSLAGGGAGGAPL